MKTNRLELIGGRTVGLAEVGPADGFPVFFFHGFGASRLCIPPDETIPERLGLRIIGVDRPGTGLSDPGGERSVSAWAAGVGAIADCLGLDRFAVMGWSAGAAYALATAAQFPDRVASATIVSGSGPPQGPDTFTGRATSIKFGQFLGRNAPILPRGVIFAIGSYMRGRPDRAGRWVDFRGRRIAPAVVAVPAFRNTLADCLAEAFRQGGRGLAWDAAAMSRDWGFRLADVRVPVFAWHGADDRVVRPDTCRHNAARLRDCRARIIPGADHFLILPLWGEILSAISGQLRSG